MHCASNFDITWVDKFLEKPWDFNEMHLHILHYDKDEYVEIIQDPFPLSWIENTLHDWNFTYIF